MANALAPSIPRTSATMALTIQNKQVPVYHKEAFQLLLPSKCKET